MKMANKPLWSQAQMEIVMHEKGALRVCAGPGTGKTTVMVARAKRLCEKLVEPGRVLIITYSRRAADEIREQFEKNRAPVVKTLHAIGLPDYPTQSRIDRREEAGNTCRPYAHFAGIAYCASQNPADRYFQSDTMDSVYGKSS